MSGFLNFLAGLACGLVLWWWGWECGRSRGRFDQIPTELLPCGHKLKPHNWEDWGEPARVMTADNRHIGFSQSRFCTRCKVLDTRMEKTIEDAYL